MIKALFHRLGLKYAVVLFSVLVMGAVYFYSLRNETAIDFEDILKSGRLRVVTSSSEYGFHFQNDSVSGFQYSLIKAFADKHGLELEITSNDDTRTNIYRLEEGEFDVLADFLPQTTEFVDKVLFTQALQIDKQMLVQAVVDSTVKIQTQSDLAGDTISLTWNSAYKMLIDHLTEQIADTIYVTEHKESTVEQLVEQVAKSELRYTICPERMAKKFQLMYPNLRITLPVGYQQATVWAVNTKSTVLLAKLNEFLKEYVGSKEYWELYRKYY